MAVTIGNWAEIDDTEIDAESPITESLMVRNRDNSYWIDAGTRKTTQTSTTKVLTPDGSGGVAWVELSSIGGGSEAGGSSAISTSWSSITSSTSGSLTISSIQRGGNGDTTTITVVNLSNMSFYSSSEYNGPAGSNFYSGTLSGTESAIGTAKSGTSLDLGLVMRVSSGTVQIRIAAGTIGLGFSYTYSVS